jgi:hypothetical protein
MKESNLPCTCSHEKEYHLYSENGYYICYACYGKGASLKVRRHGFKLDNLKLIEDLAKERKLV